MSSATQRLADVITMPARNASAQAMSAANGTVQHLRSWTTNEVDDWGRDDAFVGRVWSLSHLRWDISVGGVEHVPKRTGALIVVNARRFALAPIFAALAIGAAVDRPVRFIGRPDTAPLGSLMQRLGGLLPVEAEIEGALRAGELIVLGATHTRTNLHTGAIDHQLVGSAVAAKVRVLPTATMSVPLQRNARVEIGPQIRLRRKRRGPLEELETADHLQAHINAVLDEMGGTITGTPIDWLPNGWVGRV
jgi:1-acyl-sn-glycerol-3-phosphate acyltransferase